jgi:hypothetical protein
VTSAEKQRGIAALRASLAAFARSLVVPAMSMAEGPG